MPARTKDEEIQDLREALEASMRVIDAWIHHYAPELCKKKYVKASRQLVEEHGGVLAWIAGTQERNRRALGEEKPREPKNTTQAERRAHLLKLGWDEAAINELAKEHTGIPYEMMFLTKRPLTEAEQAIALTLKPTIIPKTNRKD